VIYLIYLAIRFYTRFEQKTLKLKMGRNDQLK